MFRCATCERDRRTDAPKSPNKGNNRRSLATQNSGSRHEPSIPTSEISQLGGFGHVRATLAAYGILAGPTEAQARRTESREKIDGNDAQGIWTAPEACVQSRLNEACSEIEIDRRVDSACLVGQDLILRRLLQAGRRCAPSVRERVENPPQAGGLPT